MQQEYVNLPYDQNECHLMFTFEAGSCDEKTTVPAKNICFCFDISGSMQGESIKLTKQAFFKALERIRPCDQICVVTYADRVSVAQEWTSVNDTTIASVKKRVEQIHCGGGTNLSGGLFKVLEKCMMKTNTTALFFTDGKANQGITDTSSLLKMASKLVPDDCCVHTLGVGVSHVPELLSGIAGNCKGSYSFIENGDQINDAFQCVLGTAYDLAFQNLHIELQSSDVHFFYDDTPCVELSLGDVYASDKKEWVFKAKMMKQSEEYRIGYSITGINILEENQYGEVGDLLVTRGHDATKNEAIVKRLQMLRAIKYIESAQKSLKLNDKASAKAAMQSARERTDRDSDIYKTLEVLEESVDLPMPSLPFRLASLARHSTDQRRINPTLGLFGVEEQPATLKNSPINYTDKK